MKCEVCGTDPSKQGGQPIYRINLTGQNGRWRCWECCDDEQRENIDEVLLSVTKTIAGQPLPEQCH